MCSPSANALLWYFIKRSTLITSSSLEALLQQAGRTKDVLQLSHCEHVRLYMEHMPMIVSTRMLYHYLSAISQVSLIS
jgi:hypothetical protein